MEDNIETKEVLVVLKQRVRYNMGVIIYLFVNDDIICKKEETCGHRSEKCSKNNR